MAGSLNKVLLIGRLGKDPEISFTGEGIAITKFSIATDESYTDKEGERKEKTEWHNIVLYRKKAETAHQYLKKGSLVYIEGKIQSREYTDRENVKRRVYDINATEFQMLTPKPKEESTTHESDYQAVYGSRPQTGPSGPKPNPPQRPSGSQTKPPIKEETPREDIPPDADFENDLPF